MTLVRRLRAIGNHPLNRANRLAALGRVLRWQAGSRILAQPVVIPFTERTRLLVSRGMTGATGNVYCGLHDFEDMCFVVHLLDAGDTFVDVGANVGTYTVLASGEAGARSICIEPIAGTYQRLLDNIFLNRLNDRVAAHNCGAGSKSGTARFTSDGDTTNHVIEESSPEIVTIEATIRTLDELLRSEAVNLIKVDVEGFEYQVLEGAREVMSSDSLQAVLLELNGSGRRYGRDDDCVHQRMDELGFSPYRYDPWRRSITKLPGPNPAGRNTLYVRDASRVAARVASAKPIKLLNQTI